MSSSLRAYLVDLPQLQQDYAAATERKEEERGAHALERLCGEAGGAVDTPSFGEASAFFIDEVFKSVPGASVLSESRPPVNLGSTRFFVAGQLPDCGGGFRRLGHARRGVAPSRGCTRPRRGRRVA